MEILNWILYGEILGFYVPAWFLAMGLFLGVNNNLKRQPTVSFTEKIRKWR